MGNISVVNFFLSNYSHKTSLILDLNVASLEMTQIKKFDAICSDKLMSELSKDDLLNSLGKQSAILNTGGRVFHSFWRLQGRENEIRKTFETKFEILALQIYTEKFEDDSFYIIAKKRSRNIKVVDETSQTHKKLNGARITEGNSNGRFELNEINRYPENLRRKSVREYFNL